jgi:hypothetical protein
MAQLLKMLFKRTEAKAPADRVREHLAIVRNAQGAELSAWLCAALFAKKTLETTRQVDEPLPDKYLLGQAPIDAAAQAALTAYAAALEKFQVALVERATSQSIAAARGLATWIPTFHAMADPGGLPEAREMWSKLLEGEGGLEEAFKFLLRRLPTDVERIYFSYRPTFLID